MYLNWLLYICINAEVAESLVFVRMSALAVK